MTDFITSDGQRAKYQIVQRNKHSAIAVWTNEGATVRLVSVEYAGKIVRLDTGRTIMRGETIRCHLELSAFE